MNVQNVKALLFDTFGTVVDWRGSVTRIGERLGARKGIEGVDWDAFARAWRAGYRPGMAPVIAGDRPRRSSRAIAPGRRSTSSTAKDLKKSS